MLVGRRFCRRELGRLPGTVSEAAEYYPTGLEPGREAMCTCVLPCQRTARTRVVLAATAIILLSVQDDFVRAGMSSAR